jgi:hypothetical protein
LKDIKNSLYTVDLNENHESIHELDKKLI